MIEEFSTREQTRRALRLVHTHTHTHRRVRAQHQHQHRRHPGDAGPDARPIIVRILPGRGKHLATGGGGLRSASGYPSRRGKRRGIPVDAEPPAATTTTTATATATATAATATTTTTTANTCSTGTKIETAALALSHWAKIAIHPEAPANQQLPRLLTCQRQTQP